MEENKVKGKSILDYVKENANAPVTRAELFNLLNNFSIALEDTVSMCVRTVAKQTMVCQSLSDSLVESGVISKEELESRILSLYKQAEEDLNKEREERDNEKREDN